MQERNRDYNRRENMQSTSDLHKKRDKLLGILSYNTTLLEKHSRGMETMSNK